jgi:carbon storage regulator CsrA
MLVLSRKAGETINIGEGVKVSVIRLEGGRVRLGIEAPENVRILRGELDELSAVPLKGSSVSNR